MSAVGYIYDESLMDHRDEADKFHPESPLRVFVIDQKLRQTGLLDKLVRLETRYIDRDELLLAHTEDHIDHLDRIFEEEGSPARTIAKCFESLYANKHSLRCAKLACGSTLELTKAILNGTIESGFANVRPPGHHASENVPSGFCFFNNVAVSALYASEVLGKRVAIIDWDIHYGDGTMSIVAGKPNIEFFSIHRFDGGGFYPYTGHPSGVMNVNNYCLNEKGDDEIYMEIVEEEIVPKLSAFAPDIVIVSCGFDAVKGDPLGEFSVSPEGFGKMLKAFQSVSRSIALVLEGGYNLKMIAECAEVCVSTLLGEN